MEMRKGMKLRPYTWWMSRVRLRSSESFSSSATETVVAARKEVATVRGEIERGCQMWRGRRLVMSRGGEVVPHDTSGPPSAKGRGKDRGGPRGLGRAVGSKFWV